MVGQINRDTNKLDGIGRKMILDNGGTIIEGQFRNNQLHGFGRIMKTDGDVMIIGTFENDKIMGFAKKVTKGKV